MGLNRTTWRPDTCGCVITYEWDPALPADERVHTPVDVTACAVHQPPDVARSVTTSPAADVFAAVLAENQTKNRAVGVVADATGVAAPEIGFRFDDARQITLRVSRRALSAARFGNVAHVDLGAVLRAAGLAVHVEVTD